MIGYLAVFMIGLIVGAVVGVGGYIAFMVLFSHRQVTRFFFVAARPTPRT